MNDLATKAEDGRPSSSSGGTGNDFIASMTVLPFQLGRAFATSRCCPNGTARMMVSASSASRNDLATTVGRPSLRRQLLRQPATRDSHVDVFSGKGAGQSLAYLSESDNRIAHSASPIHVDIPTHRIPVSRLAIMRPPRSRRLQMAEKPPSTFNSTPFTKLESSEARNSATVAISSG